MRRTLHIDVWFDFVCPWCLIGKRQLEKALALLAESDPDVVPVVRWHGVQLLPQAPAAGWPFLDFYMRRLGSEAAVRARQAQVLDAAHAAGVAIDFAAIRVMPNTARAHRLFAAACARGTPVQAEALLARLFEAYFRDGADLGNAAVLQAAAAACGLAPGVDEDPAGAPSVPGHDYDPVSGVPCFIFGDGSVLSGAQPPGRLHAAMRKALALQAD